MDGEMKQNNEFDNNWIFQEKYYPKICNIIEWNIAKIISIKPATFEDDTKRATDFVVLVEAGTVAVRIRRAHIKFRDLTIRSYNNGHKTEIDKIKEKYVRYYLYCWTDESENISEYLLLDIHKIVSSGLLENKEETHNKDGRTRFISITIDELQNNSCVLKHGIK